jgi:hypothetical protein
MRRIEKEEERLSFTEPDKQCFHLCIVNLGTCFLDNTISSSSATSFSPSSPYSSSVLFIYCTIPLSRLISLLTLLFSSLFSYSNIDQCCYHPSLLFLSSTLSSFLRSDLTHLLTLTSFFPFIFPSFLPHILFLVHSPITILSLTLSSSLLSYSPFLPSSLLPFSPAFTSTLLHTYI